MALIWKTCKSSHSYLKAPPYKDEHLSSEMEQIGSITWNEINFQLFAP